MELVDLNNFRSIKNIWKCDTGLFVYNVQFLYKSY